jgi:hypothetical protein
MKAKLTDAGIRSYQPRAAQYSIGDAACPGHCIRVTPAGIKTFRLPQQGHRVRSLGSRSAATRTCRWPERAKTRNDARKTVAVGGTPLTPKVQRAEVEKTKTYAEVVELYYDTNLTALRTGYALSATLRLQRGVGVEGWRRLRRARRAATAPSHIAVRQGGRQAGPVSCMLF